MTCSAELATAAASVQRVDEGTRSRLLNIHGWRGFNNPWMPLDEEDVDFSYINLQQNPERKAVYAADETMHGGRIHVFPAVEDVEEHGRGQRGEDAQRQPEAADQATDRREDRIGREQHHAGLEQVVVEGTEELGGEQRQEPALLEQPEGIQHGRNRAPSR